MKLGRDVFGKASAISGVEECDTISADEVVEPTVMQVSEVASNLVRTQEEPLPQEEFIALEDVIGKEESVNHPAHYNQGSIEVIALIHDWGLGFNLGNAVKYLSRCKFKGNPVEDVEKAVWYLQDALDMLGVFGTGMLYSGGAPHKWIYSDILDDWNLTGRIADVMLLMDMLRNMGVMKTADIPEVIEPILRRMILLCKEYIVELEV